VEKRQCDLEHTRSRATESWRTECDGGLAEARAATAGTRCGEQAVPHAQAAYAAASLINKSAEELDSVRIWPLIEALASSSDRADESRDLYVN
jgi:hypothetical protein